MLRKIMLIISMTALLGTFAVAQEYSLVDGYSGSPETTDSETPGVFPAIVISNLASEEPKVAPPTQGTLPPVVISVPKNGFYIQNVPYKSQRDNTGIEGRSCNATSMSMSTQVQLGVEVNPTELFNEFIKCGNTVPGDPRNMKCGLEKKYPALVDGFTPAASIDLIKNAIKQGVPVVIHGWFSSEGHVVIVIGYDDDGFWIHDPVALSKAAAGTGVTGYEKLNVKGCKEKECFGYNNYIKKSTFRILMFLNTDQQTPYLCKDQSGNKFECSWAHFVTKKETPYEGELIKILNELNKDQFPK